VGEVRQNDCGPAGIDRASAPKAKGRELTHIVLFAREIYRPRHLPRVRARGEEERRRRADLELRLAAPLLESTGQPPLHLRLAVRTCCGAVPVSPPLLPSAVHTCSSASSLCPRRPSVRERAADAAALHLRLGAPLLKSASSIRAAIAVRRSTRFESPSRSTGPSAPHLSVRFESVRTCNPLPHPVFWLTKSPSCLPLFIFVCSAFAHTGACTLL